MNDDKRMLVGLNFEHLPLTRRLVMAWHIVWRRFAFVEVPTANVAMIGLDKLMSRVIDEIEDPALSTRPRKDDDQIH